jgi:hypothetical protein
MRFHWLKDRIKQGQFQIFHITGLQNQNAADFLTKSLPVARHRLLAPFFAFDPEDSVDALHKAYLLLRYFIHLASSGYVDSTVVV